MLYPARDEFDRWFFWQKNSKQKKILKKQIQPTKSSWPDIIQNEDLLAEGKNA